MMAPGQGRDQQPPQQDLTRLLQGLSYLNQASDLLRPGEADPLPTIRSLAALRCQLDQARGLIEQATALLRPGSAGGGSLSGAVPLERPLAPLLSATN